MKVKVDEATFQSVQRLARIRGVHLSEAALFMLKLGVRRGTNPEPVRSSKRTLAVAAPSPISDPDLAAAVLAAEAPNLPRKVRRSDRPTDTRYSFEIGDHDASISDGHRTFYDSTEVSLRDKRALEYVGDLQPSSYTPLHQKLHERFTQRYRKYLDSPEKWFIPTGGQVAVDAGAYVGYKAIALHDVMGPSSRIIAIEMMLDNYLRLERNVRANGLASKVSIHPFALSAERGVQAVASLGPGSFANSIADVDQFQGLDRTPIPTFTLADVLDLHNVNWIDYLNVQVNGAELNVLSGLGRWWGRIRRAFVACPYIGDGQNEVRNLLASHGLKVHFEKPGLIVADRLS